ncbi:hypothetical protein C8R45DRAFT_1212983 [Mycena sanguinolenta]|nr:hypothetical protein C8R45DRAFT_1212983 [Mycena sanguinolenta]
MSTTLSFPEPQLKDHIWGSLRSHSPPPQNILSTISILSDELKKYDNRISQLKDELGRLESHRSALDAYHRDCHSLLAPIRRLPSEILLHIFELHRSSQPDWFNSNLTYCGMAQLAQESLLGVSRVCIRWHALVMGTPSLWSTISLYGSALSGTAQQTEITMGLLRLAFQRSESFPVDVQVQGEGGDFGPALELIASHSARWKTAQIRCSSGHFGHLAAAKGNLPLLRTLELSVGGAGMDKLDFLQSVTSVQHLTVLGSIEFCMPRLPLEGLLTYKCAALQPSAIASVVGSMSRLSYPCTVCIAVALDTWSQRDSDNGLQIPRTSSDISSLLLEIEWFFSTEDCLQTFDEIFAAVTLPSLRDLSFASRNSLPWLHNEFIALSTRSSFHSHLRSLNLLCVYIEESELVDCLSTLSALQELLISDRYPTPLVTDTLLSVLTRTPEDPTCLVPQLRVLECRSEFGFDDSVYLDFLVSRCESGFIEVPFVSRMHSIQGRYRRFIDSDVAARIQDMCSRGVLAFEWLV